MTNDDQMNNPAAGATMGDQPTNTPPATGDQQPAQPVSESPAMETPPTGMGEENPTEAPAGEQPVTPPPADQTAQ